MEAAEFTPAAGCSGNSPLYDFALRVLTRERRWREAASSRSAPTMDADGAGERILESLGSQPFWTAGVVGTSTRAILFRIHKDRTP